MAKMVACLFFLLLPFLGQTQKRPSHIQDLEEASLELGRYLKEDWCDAPDPVRRQDIADFYNTFIRLMAIPPLTASESRAFFRRTLFGGASDEELDFVTRVDGELIMGNWMGFWDSFEYHLLFHRGTPLEVLEDGIFESNYWEPWNLSQENTRKSLINFAIVLLSRNPHYSSPFTPSSEKNPDNVHWGTPACDPKATEVMETIPTLTLGVSAFLFLFLSIPQ